MVEIMIKVVVMLVMLMKVMMMKAMMEMKKMMEFSAVAWSILCSCLDASANPHFGQNPPGIGSVMDHWHVPRPDLKTLTKLLLLINSFFFKQHSSVFKKSRPNIIKGFWIYLRIAGTCYNHVSHKREVDISYLYDCMPFLVLIAGFEI